MAVKRFIISVSLVVAVLLGVAYQLIYVPIPVKSDVSVSAKKALGADYPDANPTPSHVIPFVVTRWELGNFRFDARYESDGKLCYDHVGLGVYLPHYLAIPIVLTQSANDTRRGDFAIDKFQPGKCGWKFTGITYASIDQNGVSLGVLAQRPDAEPSKAPHVDMWCYETSGDSSVPKKRKCEVLAQLRWPNAERRLNLQYLSGFSQEQQSNIGVVGLSADTEEVAVEFHDLNSIPGALDPIGDREEQLKALQEFKAWFEASPEAKVEPCFQRALGAYLRANPDEGTKPAGAKVTELKNACRAHFGLAPETPQY
jgi:hypothetical protein